MLKFRIRSSSGHGSYQVTAIRENGLLRVLCECEAARSDMHCWHRLGLLSGKLDGLLSGNPQDVEILRGWLRGTPLETAMETVGTLDGEMAALKARLSRAKKDLGIILANGTIA